MPDSVLHHEQPDHGVHVVRFLRPDLRPLLDPPEGRENALYRAVVSEISDLQAGEQVVINCGLLERFPSTFLSVLIDLREYVQERGAQMSLCCFRTPILGSFEIMGGKKMFTVHEFEESAVFEARQTLGRV